MKNESGRTILELLMVLGIITIISIASITSYTKATNNSHANDILETAGKLQAIARTKNKEVTDKTERMPLPNNIKKITAKVNGITLIQQHESLPCDVLAIFEKNNISTISFIDNTCTK